MWALVEEGETGAFGGSGSGCSAPTAGTGDPPSRGMGQKGPCQDNLLLPCLYRFPQLLIYYFKPSCNRNANH